MNNPMPPGLSSPYAMSFSKEYYAMKDVLIQQNHLLQQQDEIFKRAIESQADLENNLRGAAEATVGLNKELTFWKTAYLEEVKKYDKLVEETKLLENKVVSLEGSKDHRERESIALVLIDGDGNIFDDSLLKRGKEGGFEAAQLLTEMILSDCAESVSLNKPIQLWTYIFLNLKGLQNTLASTGICTATDFEAFVIGFNQANSRLAICDVHSGKEAADAKIKGITHGCIPVLVSYSFLAYLQSWTRFGHTIKVYFGGGHDNGYYPTLSELRTEGLLEKIVLLQGYQEIAHEIDSLHLPLLSSNGLFRSEKIPSKYAAFHAKRPPTPPSPVSISSKNSESKPLLYAVAVSASPEQLPARRQQTELLTEDGRRLRKINPNKELHKHDPPPCNLFYLAKCAKGASCRFGHDYILNEEHLETLKMNSKKSPCQAINSDSPCPFGDNCMMGHKCPQGPQCFHRKLGNCWFKGKTMHTN
ncbi:hypothetical protein M422DRAFT_70627 [Sphaerobolus stellatus SS14]|uniref:C3H1-type domain-containing protein n=1 Tax=Sphaerobolus stellatus (strain SS14) TaxID=990650 RepID=A0A0C9USW5_SPHS4|nr:hypothetical protein M422DRAFT_70627 [Sphaerobolus stellatus SS14]